MEGGLPYEVELKDLDTHTRNFINKLRHLFNFENEEEAFKAIKRKIIKYLLGRDDYG